MKRIKHIINQFIHYSKSNNIMLDKTRIISGNVNNNQRDNLQTFLDDFVIGFAKTMHFIYIHSKRG